MTSPRPVADAALGLRLFARGARTVLGSRRLLLLGAVPALVVTLLYVAALVVLVARLPDLTVLVTPFAERWSPGVRDTVRVVAGVALVAAVGAIAVVTFVAVTLAVGGPFYERLSEHVDDDLGGVSAPPVPWMGALLRGVRDGALLILLSVLAAIPLFALGLIPVVGTIAAPVAAALVGGRLLMIELTAPALERRGVRFAARRRLVRSRRALSWGVGVPTYLLAAIPFVAIIAVPMGAAAATLLARELHGESTVAPTSV